MSTNACEDILAKTVPKTCLIWERTSATSCPDWRATVPKTRATRSHNVSKPFPECFYIAQNARNPFP